jgi:hypothetical protein
MEIIFHLSLQSGRDLNGICSSTVSEQPAGTLQCAALHSAALQCAALHSATLLSTALNESLHSTALHCTTEAAQHSTAVHSTHSMCCTLDEG